jgi:endogenous inhibitor of DNA gyrase (YacG/DUF329 family)
MNDLVAALLYVADDLDKRGYPLAGAVRQGARKLAEAEAIAPSVDACPGCGNPIPRNPRGRPRRWCSERCRKRGRNAIVLTTQVSGEQEIA